MKKLYIMILAGVILLPVCASAFNIGDLSFYITSETLYNYNELANKKSQYHQSLSVLTNYKKWSAGFTLRAKNFFKQTPNITEGSNDLDLYRKYIEYNSPDLKITAGNFFTLLGRGLVLSVLEDQTIYREKTMLGGNVSYNKGAFSIRAIGGNIKSETENQEWTVAGGELILEYLKNHRAGVHFSYIDDVKSFKHLGQRYTTSFSIKGNQLFKNVSYHAEAAILHFKNADVDNGYGIFANLAYSKGSFTTIAEFKRYSKFDNELNNPPVSDRPDEFTTLQDCTGGRLYFQYAFFEPDITLFFNAGRYKEFTHTGNHFYGGIKLEDMWDKLSFTGSYGVRDIQYPVKKTELHLIYQLNDTWSLDLDYKDKRYKDGHFKFTETDHTFQVSCSPLFSVFFMHQYSEIKIIDRNHFYSGGLKVNFRSGTTAEITVGTIRGGQICSGGQCYQAPPFKGVKFSLLHIFR